jgi:hypothetical protein
VNSKTTRRNRNGLKELVLFVVLGFLVGSMSMPISASEPTGIPDKLILWSSSSFFSSRLSVDFGRSRMIKFRNCPEPIESSKNACESRQRILSKEEFRVLSHLALGAKLFSGRTRGWQIDLAFRSLEVHSQDQVEILVITLNDSFSEPGPRRQLLDRLIALEDEMAKKH